MEGVTQQLVNGAVFIGDLFFIDPQIDDAYSMSAVAGSPYFRSVIFPYLYRTDDVFRLEALENGVWVPCGIFGELASYDFGPQGVDQFRFFVLDSASLLPESSVEPFAFGLSHAELLFDLSHRVNSRAANGADASFGVGRAYVHAQKQPFRY